MMKAHADWATPAFGLAPAAPMTGPFTRRPFLEAWWRHRGEGDPLLVEGDDALLPLRLAGGTVRFVGEPDLTDYHSPLGPAGASLVEVFAGGLRPGSRLVLDSLPAEAADPLEAGLAAAGLAVRREVHEVAAVLDLPGDYDSYLGGLSGKQRHEVRRKRRRFEEALGPPVLARAPDRFGDFARMHRAAPGEKGEFLTDDLEAFFADLLAMPGTVLDVLLTTDGAPLAAAFGFEDGDAYYLYNSAFDPGAGTASPGTVLVDLLIERAIGAGLRRFDFLKGDEPYKFRLGAVPRPLSRLEAVR
jgi:CelD/BcsL family acetyltransferase involved in cellulose biosynthesis